MRETTWMETKSFFLIQKYTVFYSPFMRETTWMETLPQGEIVKVHIG